MEQQQFTRTTELRLLPATTAPRQIAASQNSPYLIHVFPQCCQYFLNIRIPNSVYGVGASRTVTLFQPQEGYELDSGNVNAERLYLLEVESSRRNSHVVCYSLATAQVLYTIPLESVQPTYWRAVQGDKVLAVAGGNAILVWLRGELVSRIELRTQVDYIRAEDQHVFTMSASGEVSVYGLDEDKCELMGTIQLPAKVLEKPEEFVDASMAILRPPRGSVSSYSLVLLYKTRLVTIIHDPRTNMSSSFETSVLGEALKVTTTATASQLLALAISKLPTSQLGLQMYCVPFRTPEDRRTVSYGTTGKLDGCEFIGKECVRVVSELRPRNMANIIGGEEPAPHSVVLMAVAGRWLINASFFEAEESIKEKQIWFGKNVLGNCTAELMKECETHLQRAGQVLDTPEEIVLESLIKAGNYQIVCDCILARSRTGGYELAKYKHVIDHVLKKFDTLMGKLECKPSSGLNAFLEQYFRALVPAAAANIAEIHKEQSYARLLLADYTTELQACKEVLRAAMLRMRTEASGTSVQLGLEDIRGRDSRSIEAIEKDIELVRRYEALAQLLYWFLEHAELGNYIVTMKDVLAGAFAIRKARVEKLGRRPLFIERMFTAVTSPTAKLDYPLSIKDLAQCAVGSKNLQEMHCLTLYVLLELRALDSTLADAVESYRSSLRLAETGWQRACGLWQLDVVLEKSEPDPKLLDSAVHILMLSSMESSAWDRHILELLRDLGAWTNAVAYARHMAGSTDIDEVSAVLDVLLSAKLYGQAYQYVTGKFRTANAISAEYSKTLHRFFDLSLNKHHIPEILFAFPFNKLETAALQEYIGKSLRSEMLLLFFHVQRNDLLMARATYARMVESKDPNVVKVADYMAHYFEGTEKSRRENTGTFQAMDEEDGGDIAVCAKVSHSVQCSTKSLIEEFYANHKHSLSSAADPSKLARSRSLRKRLTYSAEEQRGVNLMQEETKQMEALPEEPELEQELSDRKQPIVFNAEERRISVEDKKDPFNEIAGKDVKEGKLPMVRRRTEEVSVGNIPADGTYGAARGQGGQKAGIRVHQIANYYPCSLLIAMLRAFQHQIKQSYYSRQGYFFIMVPGTLPPARMIWLYFSRSMLQTDLGASLYLLRSPPNPPVCPARMLKSALLGSSPSDTSYSGSRLSLAPRGLWAKGPRSLWKRLSIPPIVDSLNLSWTLVRTWLSLSVVFSLVSSLSVPSSISHFFSTFY